MCTWTAQVQPSLLCDTYSSSSGPEWGTGGSGCVEDSIRTGDVPQTKQWPSTEEWNHFGGSWTALTEVKQNTSSCLECHKNNFQKLCFCYRCASEHWINICNILFTEGEVKVVLKNLRESSMNSNHTPITLYSLRRLIMSYLFFVIVSPITRIDQSRWINGLARSKNEKCMDGRVDGKWKGEEW